MLDRIQRARRRISDHLATFLQAVGVAQVAWSFYFHSETPGVLAWGLVNLAGLELLAVVVIALGEEVPGNAD